MKERTSVFHECLRDALSSEELVESSNSTKKLERPCSQFNRIPLQSQGLQSLLPIYILLVIHTRARTRVGVYVRAVTTWKKDRILLHLLSDR